ncbi:MAG: DNA-binding protein [Alphaproteobacteria bacterium]|nr:DNA-binding protein [Alphaproteobacteria bacterium]
MVDYTELRTVKQLAEEASFVTEAKLRWWIFHADSNGLNAALIKVGGRVYIDRRQFNRWLEGQRLASVPEAQTA